MSRVKKVEGKVCQGSDGERDASDRRGGAAAVPAGTRSAPAEERLGGPALTGDVACSDWLYSLLVTSRIMIGYTVVTVCSHGNN